MTIETHFPQIAQTHIEFKNESNFDKLPYLLGDIPQCTITAATSEEHHCKYNPYLCLFIFPFLHHYNTVYSHNDIWNVYSFGTFGINIQNGWIFPLSLSVNTELGLADRWHQPSKANSNTEEILARGITDHWGNTLSQGERGTHIQST